MLKSYIQKYIEKLQNKPFKEWTSSNITGYISACRILERIDKSKEE